MTIAMTIPTNSIGGFPSLHTPPAFIVCRYFENGHSGWCEVMISHCIFDVCFFKISAIEHLFLCLLGICTSSLEECLFRFSDKFLIELFVCF